MSRECRASGHAIYEIQYHLCWCAKCRHAVVRGKYLEEPTWQDDGGKGFKVLPE